MTGPGSFIRAGRAFKSNVSGVYSGGRGITTAFRLYAVFISFSFFRTRLTPQSSRGLVCVCVSTL
jgi:hypothetical protein